MIPSKMIVVRRIKEDRKLIADIGTELDVVMDYSRLGGVQVLRKKGGRYVCDYGSQKQKDCCKAL